MAFCLSHRKSNQEAPQQLKPLDDHLKQQRLRLHLPQLELAKQLGVQTATIYHWEHGMCDRAEDILTGFDDFGQSLLV
jgi:DNA-binding XRE family transcriptional regulator